MDFELIITQLQKIKAAHPNLSNMEILKILEIAKLEEIKMGLYRK